MALQCFQMAIYYLALATFTAITVFTCSNDAKRKATPLVKVLACDGYSSNIQKPTDYSCRKESTCLLQQNEGIIALCG